MRYLQTISLASIAAGSSKETTWSPETDIRIRRIMVTERAAGELRNVHAYMTIADNPITKPTVPCKVFGENMEEGLEVNLDLKGGTKFYVKITNGLTSAVDVDVVLEIE